MKRTDKVKKRKRSKISKGNRYLLCGLVFLVSVTAGVFFCRTEENGNPSEKIQAKAKSKVIKKAPKKRGEEKIPEKEPKKALPKTSIPKYNEQLGVPNENRIVGALPESANQHGYSALKAWEMLQSNEFPPLEDKKTIFLTFDDGPSGNTEDILAILGKYGIKATFFMTGGAVQSNPDRLKRVYEEGHAVGNHTFSHDFSVLYPGGTLNLGNFNSEIEQTEKVFQSVLGESFHTRSIRCPGGAMSWQGMDSLFGDFRNKGLASIDWNAMNGDAEGVPKTAAELISKCQETARFGTNIVLMHDTDDKRETVNALPTIIEHYLGQGYQFKILI